MYTEIFLASGLFASALLALARVFVRTLNRAVTKPDSLTDGLAASMAIGSMFSIAILAYPVILYIVASNPGGLLVSVDRDIALLLWLMVCFIAALLPGTLYFVRRYCPYQDRSSRGRA